MSISDFSNFRAVYDELTDAVANARHQFFIEHLRSWFDHIAETPRAAVIVEHLVEVLDFDAFFKESKETMGSFVGSGSLQWPDDKRKRLGMKLLVFRRMTAGLIDPLEFSMNYTYAANDFNANILELITQIFLPMAKELRRFFETEWNNIGEVPAADRVVRRDDNSAAYQNAIDALEKLEIAVRELNSYDDAEKKEQVIAELSAGRRMLQAARVRATALARVLKWPLTVLGVKLVDTTASGLVQAATDALKILLGSLF